MTVAAAIFLYLAPCDSAIAAASFVRSSTNKATGSAGSYTLSVSLSATPSAGNLLIAAISLKNKPNAEPAMSGWDTRTSVCATGNVACSYVFTKLAVGNETAVSIPINSSNAHYSGIITVLEYSGAVNTFLQSATQTGNNSQAIQTGIVTPVRSNSLIFAVVTQNNGTAYTNPGTSPDPETGWAKRTDDKNTGGSNVALNIGYFDRLSGNTAALDYSLIPSVSGQSYEWSAIIFNFDSAESAVSDIALTNTVDDDTPAVGQNVTYTITAANNGSSDNTGVQVTDALPAGLTFVSANPASGTTYSSVTGVWNIGSLANGASKQLTITATVNNNQSGQTITNTASVTAANFTDPTADNNSAPRAVNVLVTPVVSEYSPSDNSNNVSVSANLVLTFNTSMAAASGDVDLWCNGSLQESMAIDGARVSVSGTTVTINPTSNLPYSVDCYVLIDSSALQTQAGNPFGGISSNATWSFSTAGSNLFNITSVASGITTRTRSNENPQVQGQSGNRRVLFRKNVDGIPVVISDVNVAFSQHRNCSGSTFDTNVTDSGSPPAVTKAVIKLDNSCGETSGSTHHLYLLQGSADFVRICPEADELTEVGSGCTGEEILTDGQSVTIAGHTVTATFEVAMDGLRYIDIDGLVGSGGETGETDYDTPEFSTWALLLLMSACGVVLYRNGLLLDFTLEE